MEFGERLSAARKAKGFSQEELLAEEAFEENPSEEEAEEVSEETEE